MSTNPFDRQMTIAGVKHVIVVGSGKGGVGKSTVAANLALSLNHAGAKVGLLDADIYGPSVPRMFGAVGVPPEVDAAHKIQPLIRHGVRLMSMGFLVDEGSAIVWRGPMLFKAMDQMLRDVNWGELDYLVVDLPPGTGDVVLTIAQKVPVSGAIVVCTPQNLALVDAKKAMDMFDRVNIPVLGVVENMGAFTPPGSNTPIQLFPRGDLDAYLEAKGLKKLASIGFDPQIGVTTEAGFPLVASQPEHPQAKAFLNLADRVQKEIRGN